MANLVRIRDVYLYAGFDDSVTEARAIAKVLEDNNVPYSLLMYTQSDSIEPALEPIKTWALSADALTSSTRDDLKMPLIHWKNIFDNDTNCINAASGLTEFQNSQLVANLDKVVRPS